MTGKKKQLLDLQRTTKVESGIASDQSVIAAIKMTVAATRDNLAVQTVNVGQVTLEESIPVFITWLTDETASKEQRKMALKILLYLRQEGDEKVQESVLSQINVYNYFDLFDKLDSFKDESDDEVFAAFEQMGISHPEAEHPDRLLEGIYRAKGTANDGIISVTEANLLERLKEDPTLSKKFSALEEVLLNRSFIKPLQKPSGRGFYLTLKPIQHVLSAIPELLITALDTFGDEELVRYVADVRMSLGSTNPTRYLAKGKLPAINRVLLDAYVSKESQDVSEEDKEISAKKQEKARLLLALNAIINKNMSEYLENGNFHEIYDRAFFLDLDVKVGKGI